MELNYSDIIKNRKVVKYRCHDCGVMDAHETHFGVRLCHDCYIKRIKYLLFSISLTATMVGGVIFLAAKQ